MLYRVSYRHQQLLLADLLVWGFLYPISSIYICIMDNKTYLSRYNLPPCHQEWHAAVGGCKSSPLQVLPFSILICTSMCLQALEAMRIHGEATCNLRRTRAGTAFHHSAVDLGRLGNYLGLVVDTETVQR